VYVSIKPLHVSVFFHDHLQGGSPLCFVPLLFLPLICVRWVYIITQYVAACVCHLGVFGVLVCWWSACEFTSSSPTDKNTKHCLWTHKQITNRQEHQTRIDDIHMRPHTA